MKTVTFKVEDLGAALDAFADGWKGGSEQPATISFATWDMMHRTLAPKRLEILRAMCGQDTMSIRELARRVDRDFKGVHTDATALVEAGILERNDRGLCFAYDRIHVEFDIDVAA